MSPSRRSSQPAKAIPHSRPFPASVISFFKCFKVSRLPGDHTVRNTATLLNSESLTFVDSFTVAYDSCLLVLLYQTVDDAATSDLHDLFGLQVYFEYLENSSLASDPLLDDRRYQLNDTSLDLIHEPVDDVGLENLDTLRVRKVLDGTRDIDRESDDDTYDASY